MTLIQHLKRKTLLYILAGAVTLGALSGCRYKKVETSGVLHEDAKVVTRIHTPSRHDTKSGLKLVNELRPGANGELQMYPTIVPTIYLTTVPEKHGAVFKCQHGTFTSQGSDKRHKDLYDKLQDGQEVDITYKEVYRATYEDIDGDGKRDLIERVLTGFDFLDANPKKK